MGKEGARDETERSDALGTTRRTFDADATTTRCASLDGTKLTAFVKSENKGEKLFLEVRKRSQKSQ